MGFPSYGQMTGISRQQEKQSVGLIEEISSLRNRPNKQNKIIGSSVQDLGITNPLEQKIKVHVLGEVESPGVFTINVSDRLTDILNRAVLKRTSQRIIQLRHPGEATEYFDIYRYLYQGDLSQNPFLRENDVVFVPTHKGSIRVEGPVARSGIFELNGEKNLASVVSNLAGGFTASVSKSQSIKVIRVDDLGKKYTVDVTVNNRDMKNFKINKGDIIIIPDLLNQNAKFDYSIETLPGENTFYPTSKPDVYVIGAVNEPGAYPYKSYLTPKEYIGFAGAGETARLKNVTLVRNGTQKSVNLTTPLNPGDMIIVKSKVWTSAYIIGLVSTALSLTVTTLLLKDQLKSQ